MTTNTLPPPPPSYHRKGLTIVLRNIIITLQFFVGDQYLSLIAERIGSCICGSRVAAFSSAVQSVKRDGYRENLGTYCILSVKGLISLNQSHRWWWRQSDWVTLCRCLIVCCMNTQKKLKIFFISYFTPCIHTNVIFLKVHVGWRFLVPFLQL